MMKILLIGDDITITGGAERVIAVEILSIHHSNTTLPFPLAPSIKIHSTYNHSDKSKLLFKCMILYYKLKFLISTHAIHKTQKILRLIPNIQSNKGLYDIIVDNTWDSYHLFYKNKHTLYIKADKLIALMNDENLRSHFGKKAKKQVSKKFSKEAVLGLWAQLFEEMKGVKH